MYEIVANQCHIYGLRDPCVFLSLESPSGSGGIARADFQSFYKELSLEPR